MYDEMLALSFNPMSFFYPQDVGAKETNHQEVLNTWQRVVDADIREFTLCRDTAKACASQIIIGLNAVGASQQFKKHITKNANAFMRELVLLVAAYNNLFFDQNCRGYRNEGYRDFYKGAYRLCKIWKITTCKDENNIPVTKEEIIDVEQRMEFYKTELGFLRGSLFGLPINLLYPIFNPDKGLDVNKTTTEIDPIACMAIWRSIEDTIRQHSFTCAQH